MKFMFFSMLSSGSSLSYLKCPRETVTQTSTSCTVAYYCLISFQQQPAQFTNPETPGYVGFANLPNQVHRKSVKKGFEFTLMVVGKETFCCIVHNEFSLT